MTCCCSDTDTYMYAEIAAEFLDFKKKHHHLGESGRVWDAAWYDFWQPRIGKPKNTKQSSEVFPGWEVTSIDGDTITLKRNRS